MKIYIVHYFNETHIYILKHTMIKALLLPIFDSFITNGNCIILHKRRIGEQKNLLTGGRYSTPIPQWI